MAYSRGRPSSGPSIISMLSDRYKQPDTSQNNPAGASRSRIVYGQTGGGGPGKTFSQQRSEETTYSFSQEEEIKQDGRTVFKTKEGKTIVDRPQPWPGEMNASVSAAPKVSIKTITLSSSKPASDGGPPQLTNSYGGQQKQTITNVGWQPQKQDYHYKQTITTTSQYERGAIPQQQQQQTVYQIQQQPAYTQRQQQQQQQQQQQPSYQLPPQQQPSYQLPQQQQSSPAAQQSRSGQAQSQATFVQQQKYAFQQQQQQKQPGYAPQQKPAYQQQQQPGSPVQQKPTYQQQQQPSPPQQKPTYQQQQQQQPSYAQQKPTYQQQQQQQKPAYQQQPQQQQPSYAQPKPTYQQQQQQQPTYAQQKPASQQQQQQQPAYAQQKPAYQQQQQQPVYGQQKPTYQQPQQQQPSYAQQKPAYQQQPQPAQQQQQQQKRSYGQQASYQVTQQTQQQQQRGGYPQQQYYQAPTPTTTPTTMTQQQSTSTVRSTVYSAGQPSVATITNITTTTSTSSAAANKEPLHPWDEPELGVHENEPEQRPDLVRESDKSNRWVDLPSAGMAQNLKEKFLTGQVGNQWTGGPRTGKREITPDRTTRGEYVSEPRGYVEKYEPEVQAGVFENEPVDYLPGVVKSEQMSEDIMPARGAARSMATQFRQMSMEKPLGAPRGKREITPDYTTKGEYVSEPQAYVEIYEGRPESGVFESQPEYLPDVVKADEYEDDRMPERGVARNIAGYFREVGNWRPPPSPSRPKEFTPPREEGSVLKGYGVYENDPDYDPRVIHSTDHQQDILPERGMAYTMATRFRKMSSGDATPKTPLVKKEFTPPRDGGGVYENTPTQFIPEYNQRPESGVLENQPQVRYDVVRGDQPPPYEVELPEYGQARSLVSAWRQKESGSDRVTPTGSGKPKEFTPPREEPRVLVYRAGPRTPKSPGGGGFGGYDLSDGSVQPYDLPSQYQPFAEESVFESEPVYLEGVAREAETDWMEGMPRGDTTMKMVAKFRHIQQQAASGEYSPDPASRPPLPSRQDGEDRNSRETTPDKVGRSKSMRVAVQLEKCGACQKTVYAMEKIEIEKNAYHKSCFRCSHCQCILTPKTFAINKNVMFCTNHYKQLFTTKGNYDEGFGHDQHKNRWKNDSGEDSPLRSPDISAASQQ